MPYVGKEPGEGVKVVDCDGEPWIKKDGLWHGYHNVEDEGIPWRDLVKYAGPIHLPEKPYEEALLPAKGHASLDEDVLFSVEDVDRTGRFVPHPAWALFGDRLRKDNDEG